MLPQWDEGRIDPEPPGREIVRDLQQRLQLVERLVGLADQDVDPGELVLEKFGFNPDNVTDRARALLERLGGNQEGARS